MSEYNEIHTLLATCSGEVIRLEDVSDEVFSSGMLGTGFAIIPENNDFFSPVSGKITNAYETGHAYSITTKEGIDVLVHIGVDTVELDGQYFNPVVKTDMSVSQGDKLAQADTGNILSRGYDPVTVVIVTNPERLNKFSISYGKINAKGVVMEYSIK
ncbi:MAG: PTS glucose transporter subunit IIA [Clostridia bacterium]|nr:PTS glucose transporter subunit IIA [Clostridia bacterium]